MSDTDRRITPNAFLGRIGELVEFSSDPDSLDERQHRRLVALLSRLVIEAELAMDSRPEPLPMFPSEATSVSETGLELDATPRNLIACGQHGINADIFYIEEDYDSPEEKLRKRTEAKLICGRCAVQQACLQAALRSGEEYGIWGGATEEERVQMYPGEEQEVSAAQQRKEAYATLQGRLHAALQAGAEAIGARELDMLDSRLQGMIGQFMNVEALLANKMRKENAKPVSRSLDTLLTQAGLEAYTEVSDQERFKRALKLSFQTMPEHTAKVLVMYYGLGNNAAASKEEVYAACFANHRITSRSRSLKTAITTGAGFLSHNLPAIYNESWEELAANLKRYDRNEAAKVRNPFTLLVLTGAGLSLQDSPEEMEERAAAVIERGGLKQREHTVVAGAYGIGSKRPKSLQDLAKELRLPDSVVVSKLLQKALSKLAAQQTETGDTSREPRDGGTGGDKDHEQFVALTALAKEFKTDRRTIIQLLEELSVAMFQTQVGTPGKIPVVIDKADVPLLRHALDKRFPPIDPARDNTVKAIAVRLGRPDKTVVRWIAQAGFSSAGYMKYLEARVATKCFDNETTARMIEKFSNK